MGWTDSHLHRFEMGPQRDRVVDPFRTDFDDEEDDEDGLHERDVRLDQVVATAGDRLFYEYDFGDSWDHTVKVEEVAPYDDGPRASLIDGRRACPPEDCGGIPGLEEILTALAGHHPDPEHGLELLDSITPGTPTAQVHDVVPRPAAASWRPAVIGCLVGQPRESRE